MMNHFKVAFFVPLAVVAAASLYCYEIVQIYMAELIVLAGQAYHHAAFPFVALFIFRYLRLFVHIISAWCLYEPSLIPDEPAYDPADCTVVLPTVDPTNPDFRECIESCLRNGPGEIIIVTVGKMVTTCREVVAGYRAAYPNTSIRVFRSPIANKRTQVAVAIPFVKTSIIVLLDDHVFWPSLNFLRTAIAPFEDENVGAVGTNKRVRRTDLGFNMKSFFNMMGAIYLERHNFETRATNAVDGGVFVISGRTSLIRASIIQDPDFLAEFTNEMFFFGKFGPLNADDDNCITRWLVTNQWDIKIQQCNDAMIETTLGTYPKFMDQCLRWARTTWRSNTASLFTDRTVWYRQPWCVYSVYVTSFFNFALFGDAALLYTLTLAPFGSRSAVYLMIAFIFLTKMVKLIPYFLRHPEDLLMLPGYFIFAYAHSFLKLWAGLTFHITTWGGRNLGAIDTSAEVLGDNEIDDDNHGDDTAHSERSDPHSPIGMPSPVSSVASSSSSSSSGRFPRDGPHNIRQVVTPWGTVNSRNPHRLPANIQESQYASSSSHRNKVSRPLTPVASPGRPKTPDYRNYDGDYDSDVSVETDPYVELDSPVDYRHIIPPTPVSAPRPKAPGVGITKADFLARRSWQRGPECERLHPEKVSGACQVTAFPALPRCVVPGRPRY